MAGADRGLELRQREGLVSTAGGEGQAAAHLLPKCPPASSLLTTVQRLAESDDRSRLVVPTPRSTHALLLTLALGALLLGLRSAPQRTLCLGAFAAVAVCSWQSALQF